MNYRIGNDLQDSHASSGWHGLTPREQTEQYHVCLIMNFYLFLEPGNIPFIRGTHLVTGQH